MKPPIDPKTRAIVLADYVAGMSSISVAQKWGISSSAVLRYAREAGVIRSHAKAKALAKTRRATAEARALEAEVALTGGHWTPGVAGIQRWQPCFYDDHKICTINHQENRNAA